MSTALAPGRTRRWVPVLAAGAAVAAATLALHVRDPHQRGSWGFCPTSLLGFSCPGCGGLRAVHDLTDLDVAAAASSNLAFVLVAPFLVAWWARALVLGLRGDPRPWYVPVPRAVWWVLLGALAVFTLARNTAWGAWLAP